MSHDNEVLKWALDHFRQINKNPFRWATLDASDDRIVMEIGAYRDAKKFKKESSLATRTYYWDSVGNKPTFVVVPHA